MIKTAEHEVANEFLKEFFSVVKETELSSALAYIPPSNYESVVLPGSFCESDEMTALLLEHCRENGISDCLAFSPGEVPPVVSCGHMGLDLMMFCVSQIIVEPQVIVVPQLSWMAFSYPTADLIVVSMGEGAWQGNATSSLREESLQYCRGILEAKEPGRDSWTIELISRLRPWG